MIYRVSLGDLTALLDDEITDERPTPEVSRDYLKACADQVMGLYNTLPEAATNGSADEA